MDADPTGLSRQFANRDEGEGPQCEPLLLRSKPKQPEAAEPEEQQEKQELQQELLQHRRALQGQGSPRTSHVDDELRKRSLGLEQRRDD